MKNTIKSIILVVVYQVFPIWFGCFAYEGNSTSYRCGNKLGLNPKLAIQK